MKIEIEVSRDLLAGVLCSAMEGGVGYWAKIVKNKMPPKGSDLHAGFDEDSMFSKEVYAHIHFPMCEAGGGLVLGDAENDGKPFDLTVANSGVDCHGHVMLDYKALCKGLQLMATKHPGHFSNIMQENYDAETGDVLVQLSVFGKIVYG